MADVIVAQPGLVQGGSDKLAQYLKIFAGEVITAFERSAVATNRHMTRTIQSGKSAQFPVFGRAAAAYLKPGKSLDDIRTNIPGMERLITIDGLLTTSQMITDIDDALSHFDVRSEYSKQMGEALAIAADAAVLAEIAKEAVADTENLTGLGSPGVVTKTLAAGELVDINEATGKAITQLLLEAAATFDVNRVPLTERVAYLDPTFHAALVASMNAINRDFGGVGTIVEGRVARLCGFDIVSCPHITAGGADNANVLAGAGHVFPAAYAAKKPIVIAHRTSVGTLKLKDLGFERARRAEYQADMLVAKYAMGHGGLRPEACMLGIIAATV